MDVVEVAAESINEQPPKPVMRYPWRTMEVNQSFRVQSTKVYQMASRASKQYAPKRFSVRKMQTDYRVWRVK